ncbi:acetate/propionate family kinase [Pseudooceanicola sp. C21-150M6]|uniref:acetate/propionate family kinase n=1 Tax=Pseudooceanicola sp. C21-150M6 TaxID=3434355 RepID=UPI003D7FABEC
MSAILVLNAGSSSLKFALHGVEPDATGLPRRLLHGEIETLGTAPFFHAEAPDGTVIEQHRWEEEQEFDTLLAFLLDWCDAHQGGQKLIAAGHRVVHGGPDIWQPEKVTPALLATLENLIPLAPLHQPHNLDPIRTLSPIRPGLPQVACFDTAFHHGMPRLSKLFALPRDYYKEGIRRYGFHGLSYDYVARHLRCHHPELAKGRIVAAHLGNGASLCAMRDGQSMDTTMGFTATDGLMMGTRTGALDPGLVLHLIRERGMSPDAVDQLMNRESGLLGVSGLSSDMRALLASPEAAAEEAVALFVRRVAQGIGAMTVELGGLDGIVFTGGIGHHAAPVRAAVCEKLALFGVTLDAAANDAGAEVVSAPSSTVPVLAIQTDEEAVIAAQTLAVVRPEALARRA